MPYRWIVYLHLASVLGFLAAHGVSMVVPWQLRRQLDPAQARFLLMLSVNTLGASYGFLGAILVTGVLAGLAGHWWGRGWIWAALVLLIVMVGAMGAMSRPYHEARRAAGVPSVRVAATHAIAITILGVGGLLVLLWLMLFKPF